jgi:hypothetical protein
MPCRIASASPKIGDPFYRKKRMPQKGTCIRGKPAEDSPQNAKSFFLKTRMPQKGTCIRGKPAEDSPQNAKSFFPKTKMPQKGACMRRFAPFWHRPSQMGFIVGACLLTIYALTKMPPKKFRKLPSARRICTKVFRRSHFWTFFLSIFSKFFRVLNIVKFDIFLKNEVFVIIQLCYHKCCRQVLVQKRMTA